MSKLDDIFIDQYGKELLIKNSSQMRMQIKELFIELVKESEEDPEIYFGDGEKIITDRIKSL